MKVVYQASDGKIFTDIKECGEYDNLQKRIEEIKKEAKDYCFVINNCEDCPFGISYGECMFSTYPKNW